MTSSLFCNICNNLLSVITTADTFYFKCNKCQENYTPSDKDTERHVETSNTELTMYKTILLNAGQDPVNPKANRKCVCGNNIVKQVRIGSDMKVINICTKCNKQWYEGIQTE
jgi:DNA-directed RNA polymerase subunit M/transcription elongation factor TFIIS